MRTFGFWNAFSEQWNRKRDVMEPQQEHDAVKYSENEG